MSQPKPRSKMEDTQRLHIKRWSCKSSITKLLVKVEEATSCELSGMNSEVVTESHQLAFSTTLVQLKTKKVGLKRIFEYSD